MNRVKTDGVHRVHAAVFTMAPKGKVVTTQYERRRNELWKRRKEEKICVSTLIEERMCVRIGSIATQTVFTGLRLDVILPRVLVFNVLDGDTALDAAHCVAGAVVEAEHTAGLPFERRLKALCLA
jgi:hypothetical protein